MNRRNFLEMSAMAGAATLLFPSCISQKGSNFAIPPYLKEYKDLYDTNPRKAAIEWFRNARYGMFIHYGIYSKLGKGEWVQNKELIPVAEYAKLKDDFTADKFDADFITDLALEAGMKYINLTTRHHDSFCLWDTKFSDFKSTNSPAKRDLVAELYEQCNKKGLALFLYYSHGRDWRHPHAPNNDKWKAARPKYKTPEPTYKYGEEHDLNQYVEFMSNQVNELLEMFPAAAGVWFDATATASSHDTSLLKVQELYDLIHAKHPHTLVSYKRGLLGTEDFLAPERKFKPEDRTAQPLEICDTMQRGKWGYFSGQDEVHKSEEDVIKMLKKANSFPANLLLNTGPLPSGDIHPEDVAVFRAVGKRIKTEGWENLLKI